MNQEKDFDFFIKMFKELADDAHEHGLSVAVLLENADPILKEAGYRSIFRGTAATSVGLLHIALNGFKSNA